MFFGTERTPFLILLFNSTIGRTQTRAYVESTLQAIQTFVNPWMVDAHGTRLVDTLVLGSLQRMKWIQLHFNQQYAGLLNQKSVNHQHVFDILRETSSISLLSEGFPLTENERIDRILSAASENQKDLLIALIQRNEQSDGVNHCLITPLMVAATRGHRPLVELLLETYHVNPHLKDKTQCTALDYALYSRHEEIALYLMEHMTYLSDKNREGLTPFMLAVKRNLFSAARALEHTVTNWSQYNEQGLTALHIAAMEGHPDMIDYLIAQGIDVNICSGDYEVNGSTGPYKKGASNQLTPLHVCSHEPVLDRLMQYGGDLNRLNKDGESSLERLARRNKEETISIIVKSPAFHDSGELREKMWFSAASNGNLRLIQILLNEKGMDINRITKQAKNALHCSILAKEDAVSSFLVGSQIALEQQDMNGDSTLHTAAFVGMDGLLRLMFGRSVDANLKNLLGETPLYLASQEGHLDCVKILLAMGATFNLAANNGMTPAQVAWDKGHRDTAYFLLICCDDQSLFEDSFISRLGEEALSVLQLVRQSWDIIHDNGGNRLHQAVQLKSPDAIRFLCDHYPRFKDITDYQGRTPQAFAEESSLTNLSALLSYYTSRDVTSLLPNYTWTVVKTDELPESKSSIVAVPSASSTEITYAACKTIQSIEPILKSANYLESKALTLAWIAKERSNELENYQKLFEALHETKDYFKSAHQLILLECILRGAETNLSLATMLALITVAKQIQMQLGDGVFRLLFSVDEKRPWNVSDYVALAEKMILLMAQQDKKPVEIASMMRRQAWVNQIHIAYAKMLTQLVAREDTDTLKLRFSTVNDIVKVALPEKELNKLITIYKRVQHYCIKYSGLSRQMLLAKSMDAVAQTSEVKLLAILRLMVFQINGIYPYDTQMLTLLILIHKPLDCKGRIVQVRTGEGKSTLIRMLSAYFAKLNLFVDIITSSGELARRDEKEAAPFFKALGLTSSHVTTSNPTSKDFQGRIIYSTAHDLEWALLREMHEESTARIVDGVSRGFEVVIIDEADNLLMDSILSAARITDRPIMDTRWVYAPLYEAMAKEYVNPEEETISVQRIRTLLEEHQEGRHREQVALFSNHLLSTWMTSARTACVFKENLEYAVVPANNSAHTRKIVIMDYKITGRKSDNARWGKGLHEFIEAKHGIEPGFENLSAVSITHTPFFDHYNAIYGSTGTMGTLEEEHELKEINQVELAYIPPHKAFIRTESPAQYHLDQQSYQRAIFESIQQKIQIGRPVLLLCGETIGETTAFAAWLLEQGLHVQCLNDVQSLDEHYILKRAGLPGVVTVATHVAGRGTDIILDKAVHLVGGLHVILGFLPDNARVEDQAKGRAGRQGQPGSCELIIHADDPLIKKLIPDDTIRRAPIDMDVIKVLRDDRSAQQSLIRRAYSEHHRKLFSYVNLFYNDAFQPCRLAIRNIPIDALTQHCSEFDFTQSVTVAQNMQHNLVIEAGCLCLSHMIKNQKKGAPVHWESLILIVRDIYLTYLRQQWALVYAEFDIMQGERLTDEEMSAKYHQFVHDVIAPVQENPTEHIRSFISQLLFMTHQSVLKSDDTFEATPPVVETRVPYESRSLNDVLMMFRQTEFPLPESELSLLQTHYQSIEQCLTEGINTLSHAALKEEVRRCTASFSIKEPITIKPRLFSLLIESIRVLYQKALFDTQILACMAILQKPETLHGRLMQINTGEGKSLIIALVASYLALHRHHVDVVNTSSYLAKRDKTAYQALFEMHGVDENVCYATSLELESHFLRQSYASESEPRHFDCVIIDESDSLMIDKSYESTFIPVDQAVNSPWIYRPILTFIQSRQEASLAISVKELRHFMAAYEKGMHASALKKITDEALITWINSAKKALTLVENEDYFIKTRTFNLVEKQEISIVDYEHTGEMRDRMTWADGIHQFIEAKHDFKVLSNERVTAFKADHVPFFNRYCHIFGLTGTLGLAFDRQNLNTLYRGVDCYDIPPHLLGQRVSLDPMVFNNQNEQYEAILSQLSVMRQERKPVLILVKTIKNLQALSAFLHNSVEHQIFDGTGNVSASLIIQNAVLPGKVTIATTFAARGTDFMPSDEVLQAGGLHVILTFFPKNDRVERQMKGRTGRQGHPGATIEIYHMEDPFIRELTERQPKAKLNGLLTDESKRPFVELLHRLRARANQSEATQMVTWSKIQTLLATKQDDFFKKQHALRVLFKDSDVRKRLIHFIQTYRPHDVLHDKSISEDFLPLMDELLLIIKKPAPASIQFFLDKFNAIYLKQSERCWVNFFTEIHKKNITSLQSWSIEQIYTPIQKQLEGYFNAPEETCRHYLAFLLESAYEKVPLNERQGDDATGQLDEETESVFGPKPETIPIVGDGNCFFRAISKVLYGDEGYHLSMRQQICDRINLSDLTTLMEQDPVAYMHEIPENMTPEAYRSWMMQAEQYAQGNAIIKAAVLLTGKSICIHVGVSEGENKSLQHAFYNTLNGIELCGDPALLNTMQNCPKTIHLWLITNSIEPHYELIKTASPSCSITENNEDTDDGYQTDQDALAQLEIDVQESGHVKPGQNCWKKTGTMAERVLDEMCLIVSRHCFFESLQKKSYDLEITDDVISLVLPIELLEQRTDKKHSTKPKTTASASEDSLDGYLTDEELYTQLGV